MVPTFLIGLCFGTYYTCVGVCGKERALVLGGEVGQRWGEGDG